MTFANVKIPCRSKILLKNFVEIALSRTVSEINAAFNAEIQDGRQKWRENDFCENWPVGCENTLQVKNFVEIALSRSVSEINAFLRFQH